MPRNWTFGQRLGAGLAVLVALTIAIGAVAVRALRSVVESKDRVITVDTQALLDAQRLRAAVERRGGAVRGFLLTREERFVDQMRESRDEFTAAFARLKGQASGEEGRHLLEAVERAEGDYQQAADRVIAIRRGDRESLDASARAFDEQVAPRRDQLDAAVSSFVVRQERLMEEAREASSLAASSASATVLGISAAVLLGAFGVAVLLTRTLGRQIGSAVGKVESSSAELQAAASQQAAGAKQQATAMNEITTTISELLATSRQIAESARRVAQIAGQTAEAAGSGEGTVEKAHESIGGIRRQVDLVVGHMLELGKRSQQIGAVVEIVSELAEQTNILAINATIEAAGAGEAGKRFAVVADEIRKLADRVAASAKEIRGLIEDVRAAVNTTVMATESGSKAVDAGSRQFGEVAAGFKEITGLVSTTTEAAREIELSTQQQTTAVEQVNLAISNVAQATRETEASSGQTLQTAGLLAGLSRELLRLVKPQAAA
jgi:methyl-accepting chemotaxis protein